MSSPSERNTGLRAVLTRAAPYDLVQRALGAERFRRVLVRDYLRPREGERVLDVGCGTAEIARLFPRVAYVGFEPNEHYVAQARARLPPTARVVCDRVSRMTLAGEAPFDLVMAIAMLHHLDDAEARQVFELAAQHLAPGGRLVTVDNVYADGQSRVARLLNALDRGQWVRTEAGYRSLAEAAGLRGVQTFIRHDLLHVPYSHCILTWTKP